MTRTMKTAITPALIAIAAAGMAHAQTAPAPVIIDQTQLGDSLSTLVVTAPEGAEEATATNTAIGNTASGYRIRGALDYTLEQNANGTVAADTELLGGNVTGVVTSSTLAYGNSSTAGTDDGDLIQSGDQHTTGSVSATSRIDVQTVGAISNSTVAAANIANTSAANGQNTATHLQISDGNVTATSDVDMCCDAGYANTLTSASGNIASATGTTSTALQTATQITRDGSEITAHSDIYGYHGHETSSAVTASGNSYTVDNEWGYTALGLEGAPLDQTNGANVSATSLASYGSWSGYAYSSAYGVGNSASVNNIGVDTSLNALQHNTGDVSATSSLNSTSTSGGTGQVSAVAIGNASNAFLCNTCGDAVLTSTVNQINRGNIRAQATAGTTSAGGVYGTASAIGNAATFTSSGD